MESFIKQIRENWVILVAITAFIVSWSNINTRLAQADKERGELYAVVKEIQEINVSIAVIQEKISSIEKKI